MAEVQHKGDANKCSICLESYIQPRKLPRCSHTFCENCISTYVLRLEEPTDGAEFPCPFCKTINPGPEKKDQVAEWVKCLQFNDNAMSESREQNVDDWKQCSPCKIQGKTSKGTRFCVNCNETMCGACSVAHNAWKLMRNHKLLDIDEGRLCKSDDVDIVLKIAKWLTCPNHQDKAIEYHCLDHNILVCLACAASTHRKCNRMIEINTSINKETVAKEASNLKSAILILNKYAEDIIKAKDYHVNSVKKQSECIQKTLENIRNEIVKLLEALEDNINKERNAMTKAHTISVFEDIDAIKEIKAALNSALMLMDKTIKDGSPIQLYVIVHCIRKTLNNYEATIVEMAKHTRISELKLKQHDILTNFLSVSITEIDRLAAVEERQMECSLPQYEQGKHKMSPVCSIESFTKLHIEGGYTGSHNPTYTCVVYLQDGLLLIDEYRQVCIFTNKNRIVVKSRKFSNSPVYATIIGTGHIAVVESGSRKVYCLSADDQLEEKSEVITKHEVRAIQGLSDGTLAVAWKGPVAFGLAHVNLVHKEYFTCDKNGRKFKSFDYIAVNESLQHVIQPCSEDKAVYCFDFKGNPIFKYTSSELQYPRGVALDMFGNIYICDYSNSCIHVITSSGNFIQVIRNGCPKKPLAIAFNSECDEFAVTNGTKDWCEVTFFKLRPTV